MQTLNEFNNFHKSIHYLQELSPVAQSQAFDFIEFLRQKYNVSVEPKNEQITTGKMKKRQAGSLKNNQIHADKVSMAGCLSEYANPALIEQEEELLGKALTSDLKDKYFAD